MSKIKRPTGREHNGRPVIMNAHGYITIYEPTHPSCGISGRVLEHRWVVEQFLGRYLTTREQVDHINQDKTDNRIENLQLLSPEAHTIKTNADRKRKELTMTERLAEYERRFGPLSDG
jgi:5-methylcytosine-specific restriction endonuclease McrA